MSTHVTSCGSPQPRELHLVDGWWELYGERFPDWGPYTEFGALRTRDAYEDVVDVLRAHSAEGVATIHFGNVVEVLGAFPDAHFDSAYLDTSHEYEATRDELEVLRRKVKAGGLITGDDWNEWPDPLSSVRSL